MAGWVTLSMGQFEEDTAAANKLFVEAVKLVKMAENAEALHEWRKGFFNLRTPRSKKADALLLALRKLNEIIDDYPSTDLAVKLINGQDTGSISLEDVGEAAERARIMYYEGGSIPENYAEQFMQMFKVLGAK